MRHEESDIQIACVRWFGYAYNEQRQLLNSIPNGGRRDAVTASILKAEGVVPGVADLELNIARHGYHGLKIEMKTSTGRQSPSQKEWQRLVTSEGYKYIVCRSVDDFIDQVSDYMTE